MNGPLSMYKLKPLVEFSEKLEISQNMYTMKNIYGLHTSQGKPGSEIEVLQRRQEEILKQLNYLKDQMLVLRQELAKKGSSPTSNIKSVEGKSTAQQKVMLQPTWNGVIGEIVVHASPEFPPYSLLAVNQLWPQVLRVRVTCHAHSSVSSLPTSLDVFSPLASTSQPTLSVRLIWKAMGPDCEMVISPLTHCAIRGEVNLLRYLQRSIVAESDVAAQCNIDRVLDISHRLNHSKTARDKQLNVRALNSALGKSSWLVGDEMSVVDLAAWSSLRSLTGIDLSQNMTKWQQKINALLGVEAA